MFNKYSLLALICALFLINQKIVATGMVQAELVPVPHSEFVIDHRADQAHKAQILKERAKKRYEEFIGTQDTRLYEEVFNNAPVKIKSLVNSMLMGEQFTEEYKALLLTGPSGSGKSTLAQAIAYKLKKKFVVINAPSLLGHYRDKAAENLRDVFKEIDEDPDKPVLIMDEMNVLTDGHTSEHSDTKNTAMQLWTLLDQHRANKDFLFIGTTNITKKMPHQLQSRFKGKTFLIENPSNESRARALHYYMQNLAIKKDHTCSNAYVEELAKKTEAFSQRDIKTLITSAILLSAIENPQQSPRVITKKNIEEAYNDIIKENEFFWDFQEHTTDEERRHRENMAQNQKQFETSQETQIRLAEWNLLYQAFRTEKWADAVNDVNNSKSFVFPNKKNAANVVGKKTFWEDNRKLEKNS